MKLNHLNLPVADVRQLHDFLIKHFGFASESITDNGKFAVLRNADDFVIVSQQSDEPFPKDFHIGYLVNDAAIVESKYNELQAAGANVSPLKHIKRGKYVSYTFYCSAHGLLIEVSAQSRAE